MTAEQKHKMAHQDNCIWYSDIKSHCTKCTNWYQHPLHHLKGQSLNTPTVPGTQLEQEVPAITLKPEESKPILLLGF